MVNPTPRMHSEDSRPDGRFIDVPDSHYLEALECDDGYLGYFTDRGLILISRFKHPTRAVALKRGWSNLVGNTATDAYPRGGAPWTAAEQRDLLVAAAGEINLTRLAKMHGRTETAISCRLEALGVDKGLIAASDFSRVPVEPPAPPKPRVTPTSPESRLKTLLSIAMGFTNMDHVRKLPPADITFLVVDELIEFDPAGKMPPVLTDRGRHLVDSLVGRSTGRKKATVAWNQARQTSELTDGTFFLVANGDVHKNGNRNGDPALVNAPRTVHSGEVSADREAHRLASENPGVQFFVLQAVAVHKTPLPVAPSTTSKRV